MPTPPAPRTYRTTRGNLLVRPVGDAEIGSLWELIRHLARYEQALERMTATREDLREALRGSPTRVEAVLAFLEGEIVGYAMFYPTFSTYLGRECLHLEDLFVSPAARGAGVGKALLAYLAEVTRSRHLPRLEWSSLAWNEEAKQFYERLGAKSEARMMYALSGDALEKLTDHDRE